MLEKYNRVPFLVLIILLVILNITSSKTKQENVDTQLINNTLKPIISETKNLVSNLIFINTQEGEELVSLSKKDRTCLLDRINKFFSKQTHPTFCGVQSSCIVLNTLLGYQKYKEESWWSNPRLGTKMVVNEDIVREQGLTIDQCTNMINEVAGGNMDIIGKTTDQSSEEEFRITVDTAMMTGRQALVNYDMKYLGLNVGGSGHFSPLAGFVASTDMVLVMDVWPQNKEYWVPLTRLWTAMDTLDNANSPPTKRGYIIVTCSDCQD